MLVLLYTIKISVDLYVVAVDLPGHGQSSHRPKGVPLHYEDDLTTIKYVVDGAL